MAVPLLDLKAQHATIREEVISAIMPVIDGQTFILGQPVEQIERLVAKLSQTKYAIGCANGTVYICRRYFNSEHIHTSEPRPLHLGLQCAGSFNPSVLMTSHTPPRIAKKNVCIRIAMSSDMDCFLM